MQAKVLSVLVVAFIFFLFLVVAVMYRVMRRALRGIAGAARDGRYVRSSVMQPGFEPDTVLGWSLAIVSMLIALAGLTGLVVGIVRRAWF
jgi:hypothetical protein